MTDDWILDISIIDPQGYRVAAQFHFDDVAKLLNYPLSHTTGKCIRFLAKGIVESAEEGHAILDGKDEVTICDTGELPIDKSPEKE